MNLTCEDVIFQVHRLGGMVVGAHLNKLAYNSLIKLGFIPGALMIDGI